MMKEQAAAFICAFNAMHPYVPPILFSPVAESEAMRIILAIANGMASADIKPVAPIPLNEEKPNVTNS